MSPKRCWKGAVTGTDPPHTSPGVHVLAWGTQNCQQRDTVQTGAAPRERQGCRDTAPHSLPLPEPAQTPKITANLTLHQRWEHSPLMLCSPSFPTTCSLCPPPGRHGCSGMRDESSPKRAGVQEMLHLAGRSSAYPVEDAFAPLS